MIAFELNDRRIRFNLRLPTLEEFERDPAGRRRPAAQVKPAYERELRRRWRWMFLTIEAKFASVQNGIEQFDAAFLAQIVLPNGQTLEEWATPQLIELYVSGKMPPMLPPV